MTAPRLPAWRIPEYRRLWFGTVFIALANQCERLAISWLVLLAATVLTTIAEIAGVQWTLIGSGALVVLTGFIAYLSSSRLRTA